MKNHHESAINDNKWRFQWESPLSWKKGFNGRFSGRLCLITRGYAIYGWIPLVDVDGDGSIIVPICWAWSFEGFKILNYYLSMVKWKKWGRFNHQTLDISASMEESANRNFTHQKHGGRLIFRAIAVIQGIQAKFPTKEAPWNGPIYLI